MLSVRTSSTSEPGAPRTGRRSGSDPARGRSAITESIPRSSESNRAEAFVLPDRRPTGRLGSVTALDTSRSDWARRRALRPPVPLAIRCRARGWTLSLGEIRATGECLATRERRRRRASGRFRGALGRERQRYAGIRERARASLRRSVKRFESTRGSSHRSGAASTRRSTRRGSAGSADIVQHRSGLGDRAPKVKPSLRACAPTPRRIGPRETRHVRGGRGRALPESAAGRGAREAHSGRAGPDRRWPSSGM